MSDTQTWKALWFPFCQRKVRLSLCLTVPLADSPHMERMQDAWIWSYTSGVRVSCSDTHTSDKYSPCCSDHILLSGFGMLGKPNIPKRSAGQGLSSTTMNRSTIILCIHSREAFAGKRNWHVGRVGIAGLLCHHLQFLLAPHSGMPYGFTYEKALRFSPSVSSGVLATFPSSYCPCFALVL